MKKKLYCIVCLCSLVLIMLCACGKKEQGNPIRLPDKEDIVSIGVSDGENSADNIPLMITFQASVIEKNNDSIIVKPEDSSLELASADKFYIPNVENLELQIGDLVEISYNGEIMESYPAQLGEVYKITVIDQTGADAMWDRIPMVRVNGKLYYDTGRESTVSERCGNMDGKITSTVDGTEIPTEDNQSNFGSGFGYQYGRNDTIEIYMNEKWFVFECREESE